MFTECFQLVHGIWILKYFLICFGGWAAMGSTYLVTTRYVRDTWKEFSDARFNGKPVPNPVPGVGRQIRLAIPPAGLTITIAVSIMVTVADEAHRIDTLIILSTLMLPTVWFAVSSFFHEVARKRRDESAAETSTVEEDRRAEAITA
jgi:hypothetical protein